MKYKYIMFFNEIHAIIEFVYSRSYVSASDIKYSSEKAHVYPTLKALNLVKKQKIPTF